MVIGSPTYEVEYRIDDANYGDAQIIEKGGYASPPPEPYYGEGRFFIGWFSDRQFTSLYDFNVPVSGDVVLYGLFVEGNDERSNIRATFFDNGVIVDVKDIKPGMKCARSEPADKEGYVFSGWYRTEQSGEPNLKEQYMFDSPLYDDIRLYACWTKFDGGDGSKVMLTLQDEYGGVLETQVVDKGGYFDKNPQDCGIRDEYGYNLMWKCNGNKIDLNTYRFNTNSTIRAYYEPDYTIRGAWYDVKFNFWDGNNYRGEDFSMKVRNGDVPNLKSVSISDYKVIGWYTDSERHNSWDWSRKVSGNDVNGVDGSITLYAKLSSNATPYYEPFVDVASYSEDGVLMYTYYEHGVTRYLYYMGSVEDLIIHTYKELDSVYNDEVTYTFTREEMNRTTTTVSTAISYSYSDTNGITTTLKHSTPNSTKTVLNVGSAVLGVLGAAAGVVAAPFSGGTSLAVTAAGISLFTASAGAAMSIGAAFIPDSDVTYEEIYQQQKEEIQLYQRTTSEYTHSVTEIDTVSYSFRHLVPNVNHKVAYVLLGDVDYFQLVTVDEDGAITNECFTTLKKSKPAWVCVDSDDSFKKDPMNIDKMPIYPKNRTLNQLRSDEAKLISTIFGELETEVTGEGTVDNPFIITSVEQFMMMGYCSASSHFKLGCDIDLSSVNPWKPLPPFSGTLDGDGHVIRGLKIRVDNANKFEAPSTASPWDYGLFQELGCGARIENLTFENPDIRITSVDHCAQVGVICGWNATSTISNVTITGAKLFIDYDVAANSYNNKNCGIVAGHSDGTLMGIYIKDSEIEAFGNTGGLVGEFRRGKIIDCHVLDTGITYRGKDGQCHSFGGLAGYSMGGRIIESTVEYVEFTFKETGTNSVNLGHSMGYLVGHNQSSIENSVVYGCSNILNGMTKTNVMKYGDEGEVGSGRL